MSNTSTIPNAKLPTDLKSPLQRNLDKLVEDARKHEKNLDHGLAACAGPIVKLPESLNQLVETNRLEDIPKVQALTKSIREDLNEITPKVQRLKSNLEKAVKRPAKSHRQMTDKYSRVFAISTDMLLLSGDVFDTAAKSTFQLDEILNDPTPSTAPEA